MNTTTTRRAAHAAELARAERAAAARHEVLDRHFTECERSARPGGPYTCFEVRGVHLECDGDLEYCEVGRGLRDAAWAASSAARLVRANPPRVCGQCDVDIPAVGDPFAVKYWEGWPLCAPCDADGSFRKR